MKMTPYGTALVIAVLLAGWCAPARAWIYPEHRSISGAAWHMLQPNVVQFYASLWERARGQHPTHLCSSPLVMNRDSSQPPCIELVDWPAIAADHSCSPEQLAVVASSASWVLDVTQTSEQIANDLAESHSTEERENLWITSNLRLQAVDHEYVTRAGGNSAHFSPTRAGRTLAQQIAASTQAGASLNAMGLYVQYHVAALQLAASMEGDTTHGAPWLAQRVLALEAYALHFLQDMFASGHVAGSWGDAATRKGTHDYYCAHGYATTDWSGHDLILSGDAHMKPVDLARAAEAMALSMTQVFEASAARGVTTAWAEPNIAALELIHLNSCERMEQPAPIALRDVEVAQIEAVLQHTPKPGYGEDSAGWPRYRADFGPFIGIESGISMGAAIGSYGGGGSRAMAELGIGVRLGYGLEGVVAALNTGTMYLHLGLVRQSEQVDFCSEGACSHDVGSQSLPRVPSRAGVALGLRMPFWLIPGDLIVLAPILALLSPDTLTNVAIQAASGGLIPWQRTFITPVGHFEFVLGRALGATFYGLAGRVRSFAVLDAEEAPASDGLIEAGSRAVALTFPVLEYTPLRVVAQALTASLQLQLAYAIEIPFDIVRYGPPTLPGPEWGPAHLFLLRISLSGRGYL